MKTIVKYICIVFTASLALAACSPDDDHSLGTYNEIRADQVSFQLTTGSDEWTYNYTITFSDDLSTLHSCQISFGDGETSRNLTGSHGYYKEGTYTAQCTVYAPDGKTVVKEIPVVINRDKPQDTGSKQD